MNTEVCGAIRAVRGFCIVAILLVFFAGLSRPLLPSFSSGRLLMNFLAGWFVDRAGVVTV